MNLRKMKDLQINKVFRFVLLLGTCFQILGCVNQEETNFSEEETGNTVLTDIDSLIDYGEVEDKFKTEDVIFWTEIISSFQDVQELYKKMDNVHITNMSGDKLKDSMKFQVQHDDGYRYIPIHTYYVYPVDSVIKKLNTINDVLTVVHGSE